MTAPAPHHQPSPPATAPRPSALRCVFPGTGLSAKYGTMQPKGSSAKYLPVKDTSDPSLDFKDCPNVPLTDTALRHHLAGTLTIAAPLVDEQRMGRVAVADIDSGGPDAVRRAWEEATRRGYRAWGFMNQGTGDHNGGYLVILFDQDYHADRHNALIKDIGAASGVACDPRANRANTRLPFGYHRQRETWGRAIDPQGKEYDLGDADTRRAALHLFTHTVNTQAPPKIERPQVQPRPLAAVAVADVAGLKALRERGRDLAARLTTGHLDKVTWAALHHELYEEVNPVIKASVATVFNAAYTCQDILERHGAVLMRDEGRYLWYGALPRDRHSNPNSPKYRVDTHTGKCFGVSPNGTPGNDTRGHDACSLERIISGASLEAIADSLTGPITRAALPQRAARTDAPPMPEAEPAPTAEQRRADADRKKAERQRQRDQAAATQAAAIERANADPRLLRADGRGNIAFTVLLALLDFMGLKTWCRPSVPTLAKHIGCSQGHARRGLADLEQYGYITTTRNVNPETGEVWSGGRAIDTPIRTLCESALVSVPTPQTEETGQTLKTVDVCHVLVTESNSVERSNQQAPPLPPPASAPVVEAAALVEAEPESASESGERTAAYWAQREREATCAAQRRAASPLRGRTKEELTADEHWRGLSDRYAGCWHATPADDVPEAEQQQLDAAPATDAPPAKAKTRRRASRPAPTPGDLLKRYYKALGRADRLALDPATRRQAEAIRRDAAQTKARYDALQLADAAPEADTPGEDGGGLLDTSLDRTRELPPEPSPFLMSKVWTLAEQRRLSAAAAAHYQARRAEREGATNAA